MRNKNTYHNEMNSGIVWAGMTMRGAAEILADVLGYDIVWQKRGREGR